MKMKAKRLLSTVLAAGLGIMAVTSASDVYAQARGKKKEEPAAPVVAGSPAMTKRSITLTPAGLQWGMNHKQVAEVIDKQLDEDYKPRYQKVSPGVRMRELDAQLAEDKNAFRRSRIDFGKLPTGVDSTPLKGEYTYLNKESMMSLTRNGQVRYFFFIQDKLWKVVDEHKLAEGHMLGKTWEEAVIKLVKTYGTVGRVLEADYAKGRNATEVDWKDAAIHMRAIQRGDTAVAVVYEDLSTLNNLQALRPNKPKTEEAIDPAVAAAMKGAGPPEPPPPPAEKPKGKK